MSNIDPSAGTPTDALGLAGTPDDIAKQLYGYMAWALDDPAFTDPKTGVNVLREAASGGWSQDMLKGALYTTQWWKTSSDSMRQWDNLMGSDPATANAQITNKAAQIHDQLIQEGVNLDPNAIRAVAQDALRFGWDDAQLKTGLDAELQRSPDVLKSKVGADYKALASQYAVPLADSTVSQWAAHSISGVGSDEQYRQYLVAQAKSRFQDPTMQKFLDSGGTVSQFYDPYKQMAGQTLGIDPNTIDLTDPKWTMAVNARDPSTGQIRAMTLDEWDRFIKSSGDYGYQNTDQAKQAAASFTSTIGTMFGKSA